MDRRHVGLRENRSERDRAASFGSTSRSRPMDCNCPGVRRPTKHRTALLCFLPEAPIERLSRRMPRTRSGSRASSASSCLAVSRLIPKLPRTDRRDVRRLRAVAGGAEWEESHESCFQVAAPSRLSRTCPDTRLLPWRNCRRSPKSGVAELRRRAPRLHRRPAPASESPSAGGPRHESGVPRDAEGCRTPRETSILPKDRHTSKRPGTSPEEQHPARDATIHQPTSAPPKAQRDRAARVPKT